ncbi:MAG: 3-phosphoshikimate 1-carboxyvinyltransferase [Helicobacteraceae bacterium]|jgi:3-phosphoshikimate 1-carboxyvinyltransferase|nr:3-phosphoshikimate 1-carboxyvinyltransferase [Helicobacteraceae bacterium]
MKKFVAARAARIEGEVSILAADKSISHRCAIFSLLSEGEWRVENFLRAEDTLRSLAIAEQLGAKVAWREGSLTIKSPSEIVEPVEPLDCGNAGTAMRLYIGFLAAQKGFFVLSGDRYLNNRPMKRVAQPLREIGASIDGRKEGGFAPIAVRGNPDLARFNYASAISSAQVKSALVLAGLCANGGEYFEGELSRDHTERMLSAMGAAIVTSAGKTLIAPKKSPLKPLAIRVPADPSSGFFFAVAAAICEKGDVLLRGVTLNPTRIEAYKVLARMGAIVEFIERENDYEPIGDIRVRRGELRGAEIGENISWLIDELPALAIACAFAEGVSRVTGAAELRVKESDRIKSAVSNLVKCGVNARELPDGFEITGGKLRGAKVESFGDHRIAMSFAIAGIAAEGEMTINDTDCIATSFPNFAEIYRGLGGALEEGEAN